MLVSQVALTVTLSGDKSEVTTLNDPANASSPWGFREYPLLTGNNSVPVPQTPFVAQRITIRKPPGNTVVLLYKGVNGDTGVPCSLTLFDSFSLPAAAMAVIINAASGVTVEIGFS